MKGPEEAYERLSYTYKGIVRVHAYMEIGKIQKRRLNRAKREYMKIIICHIFQICLLKFLGATCVTRIDGKYGTL